jgi:GTP cyclohydrolase IA
MSRTAMHADELTYRESDGPMRTLDAAPMSDVVELRRGDRQPVPDGTNGPPVDRFRAEAAARELLEALAVDVTDESTRDTPRRLVDVYAELLSPAPFNPTTFPNDGGYDELVVARAIPFHSLCEHHLLPFVGVAHVGYLPGERILGLSKLARVVDYFARSVQVQERLTRQIAGWLGRELRPKGVGVVLEAEHMCMSLRGVQKAGSSTVTSALHGAVRDDQRTRGEFLALTGRPI